MAPDDEDVIAADLKRKWIIDPIATDPVEAVAGADGSLVPRGILSRRHTLSRRRLFWMRASRRLRERFWYLRWILSLLRR